MARAVLTLLALAALAACEATMTSTGSTNDVNYDMPAEGADPPGSVGPNATPWWAV